VYELVKDHLARLLPYCLKVLTCTYKAWRPTLFPPVSVALHPAGPRYAPTAVASTSQQGK
jgi:hypothetical protein